MVNPGLLTTIRQSPEDDAPRRIYADWLDDHGEHDRAEFIRTQLELANLDHDADRVAELLDREQELLTRHRETWQAPFTQNMRPYFCRGFVSAITLSARDLARRGKSYLGAAPVERVAMTEFPEDPDFAARLAKRPFLSQLRTLDLYASSIGEAAAQTLFASEHLRGVRSLHLGEGDTTPQMMQTIADRLPAVRELWLWDFHQGELGDEGLSLIANTRAFAGLTVLDLLNTGVTAAGMQALADSPHVRRLQHLSLGLQACGYAHNRIGAEGVRILAQAKNLADLRHLSLTLTSVGDEGIRALATSSGWMHLRSLDLAFLDMGPAGVAALAEWPGLASVKGLNLSRNAVGDDGLSALSRSPMVGQVETLWLAMSDIGASGLRALAESPSMARLRRLGLGANDLDAASVQVMLGDNRFAQLVELNIQGCRGLDDAARRRLSERFGTRVKLP